MTGELTKAQDIFLDRINQICGKFGLNNVMAQLYAVLYMSGKPMSLTDMAERLKISKPSASINIRSLERYGVVRKVWVKGSRRDYYEADSDIYKVLTDRVKSMAEGRLSELEEMLDSSYRALYTVNSHSKEEKEASKVFRQKLDELKSLHGRVRSAFNLLNSGFIGNIMKTKSRV